MSLSVALIVFMFGAAIGSFLNVVVLRHEAGKKLTGRSMCPHCGRQLSWHELVPIVSWLWQRGRCRGCDARISCQYPLVEFATAVLFILVYAQFSAVLAACTGGACVVHSALFVTVLVIWATLVVITVYDLRTKLIPNVFSFTLIGAAAILYGLHLYTGVEFSWWHIAAGPLFYLPYWILWKVSDGRWIGLGDAKLSWGIGWFLGLSLGGSAILYGFWIGALCSLLLMGAQRLVERSRALGLTSEVPFGPYLVLGTAIAYFFQLDLFAWLLAW